MSMELQAIDAIKEVIEQQTDSDHLTPQECANVLAEIAAQVEAQLDALKEDGVEPE